VTLTPTGAALSQMTQPFSALLGGTNVYVRGLSSSANDDTLFALCQE
jgi:hypothetical protein